ncbi:MAG TPA: hypothetical protein VGR02_02635 [Thermoanaerobaculia bacterium]|jgi:hypothetical protein|nr:hypothetical protein [Thermoanaerobaculia bacterium]
MQSLVLAIALTLPIDKVQTTLVAKYGEAQRPRIERGVRQAAEFWRAEDGDAAAFEDFATTNFAPEGEPLDALFNRLQFALESVDGHMAEISRDWKWQSDLDVGPVLPFDELMAGYEPSAHLNEDLFGNRLAHVVLLNFPLTTLDQRLQEGEKWSRRQWAEAKLALRFSRRVPSSVNVEIGRTTAVASQFAATYNIWMHHVLGPKGERLFPAKMRLLEHWNLRDEIKADYSDREHGIAKQRILQKVMERIVDGTIPSVVVDNPRVDWNPFTNEIKPSTIVDYEASSLGRPPDAGEAPRYAMILSTFHAARLADPYSPTAPTHIARKFEEDRQLPEGRVKKMLEQIVASPLVPRVGKLIEQRLGRKLEPFDLWYNGFRPRAEYTGEQLDELVRKRYPTAAAYAADMPRLLEQLGFTKERAASLAARIAVDPARGSGHALPSSHRQDKPRLRTRVGGEGMDYKGYNIAVHEMGHTVEQVFSLNDIDYYTLSGVPNNAFTEALAFVFQAKDLELLGLARPSAEARSLQTLNDFWGTYEISGVALVEMEMWHWMYDHPDATPAQLRDATVRIAKDVWNRYYAPVFGERDVTLLGVYAHMVNYYMYLPDYPIGHMIAFQIEEQMEKAGNIGSEFERMAKFGSVTPDLWMRHASGAPVGPEALLAATERALANR